MKKIGIDARLYSQTGVGTYLHNLLHYLDEKNSKKEIYYLYFMKQDAIKYKSRFKSKNIVIRVADYKWHSLSEQVGFLILILKDDLDLMHFTYFSYPIFYFKKFIATIHDTTPLIFRTGKASTKNSLIYQIKHFIFRIVLWSQVNKAKKIITPTNTIKRELIKIYGTKISSKVKTLYEGIGWKFTKTKENEDLKKKFNNFFIYVGNFYPHKNVEKLIEAFSRTKGDFKLILIGPDDYFTSRILHYINIMKCADRVVVIKNPALEDLIFFYKNAKAIIHPSLSEGFGLPLVEAAYFNTPIIASNISVFKELWGSSYVFFDPYSISDIAEKINDFINKKPKFDYKKLLKKYSFERMTDETLKIYQSVTQNS